MLGELLLKFWYYQSWLVAISFAAYYIKGRTQATAVCVLIAYVAVSYYPLLGMMIHGR